MRFDKILPLVAAFALASVATAHAEDIAPMSSQGPLAESPLDGGPVRVPYKSIIQNAGESREHTRLLAAVKAAGLDSMLDGPGPYTVFAPTDDAFAKLPAGTIDTLLKPENRAMLVKIISYHVVPGKMTGSRIRAAIKAGGGTATLTTVEGEPLTASLYDDRIVLTDARGASSTITRGNVFESNGLTHVVDTVLMP